MSTKTHMHVALRVSDLDRSIAFYESFFGIAAAKSFSDYAKFEVAEPALVLSLNPAPGGETNGRGGRLSHLGIRVGSADGLKVVQSRLAEAGLSPHDEPGTTCCYALQDKVWVTDPDGNAWEVYWLDKDTDVHTDEASSCCPTDSGAGGCC